MTKNSIEVLKRYTIKIPKDISIIYCENKKILTFIGPQLKKSLKLTLKILLSKEKQLIIVTSSPFSELSNNQKKKIKALQGTAVALIKQIFVEISTTLYKKLKFVGVGYKAFIVENFEKVINLKLGFSHPIYFKISNELELFCKKQTHLFIFGNSYQLVTNSAAKLRSLKKPEPYKGKGILYTNEQIILKEGKKV